MTKHWSKTHGVVVVSSNLGKEKHPDCSEILIKGEKAPGSYKLVVGVGGNNLMIADVPFDIDIWRNLEIEVGVGEGEEK